MKASGCWCNGQCPNEKGPIDLFRSGKPFQAEGALRRILVDAPACVRANEMLAEHLSLTNRGQFAMKHIERAAGDSDAVRFHLIRAQTFRAQMKLREAIADFRRVLDESPNNIQAHAGLIDALEKKGDLERADKAIEIARANLPFGPSLRRAAAGVRARQGEYKAAISELSTEGTTPIEFLDRGRYREAIGDYAAAWQDWMTGKRLLRERGGHTYQREMVERLVMGMYEIANTLRLNLLKATSPADEIRPLPIFICGHPRSGTTLAETVITSHPKVAAGDELQFVAEIARQIPRWLRVPVPYPAALMGLAIADNDVMTGILRDYYWRKSRVKIGFNVKRHSHFTDKMPLNEIHLPLIKTLFPSAPVLYMRRHPLDIMISNMSHYLTHGHYYACSLETAADHYALVDGLMMHFRKRMYGSALEIRYESFVANQRAQTDAMLAFCDLAPNEACYMPEKNPRDSRTISYAQVKEPVSAKAIGRYKPFLAQLEPVLDVLRPICEREGYEI